MRIFNRRRKLTVAVVIAMLAFAGAAFAYFTTTGSGTGNATVGTSTALTLHAAIPTTLYPGTTSPVNFTVDNSSAGFQLIGTITLASVTVDSGHSTCATADFTMPDVASNQQFANGSGLAVTAQGTVTMADTAVSQDACKGATITLHVTSN